MARRKKKRTHVRVDKAGEEKDSGVKIPKTMVFRRGESVGSRAKNLARLVHDVRQVMLPHTAMNLKESKRNTLKDFIQVAGPLGVTHFMMFSTSSLSSYLKVARVPDGPTLTFRMNSYTSSANIQCLFHSVVPTSMEFQTPPLLILRGMGSNVAQPSDFVSSSGIPLENARRHIELTRLTFRDIFPSLNFNEVNLSKLKRVLLLSYDEDEDIFRFRHYLITTEEIGISKPIGTIVKKKINNLDLSSLSDISQFVMRSDTEESSKGDVNEPTIVVDKEKKITRTSKSKTRNGNKKSKKAKEGQASDNSNQNKKALKLVEVGPRMDLVLVKVEEGLCRGEVRYHKFVHKSEEAILALQQKKEQEAELKQRRKAIQEENVARKKKEQEELLLKKKNAIKEKSARGPSKEDDSVLGKRGYEGKYSNTKVKRRKS